MFVDSTCLLLYLLAKWGGPDSPRYDSLVEAYSVSRMYPVPIPAPSLVKRWCSQNFTSWFRFDANSDKIAVTRHSALAAHANEFADWSNLFGLVLKVVTTHVYVAHSTYSATHSCGENTFSGNLRPEHRVLTRTSVSRAVLTRERRSSIWVVTGALSSCVS